MVKVPALLTWRTKRALSQRDLAKRANVAATTILRLEHGEDANFSTVRKLAEALDIPPDKLYETA